MPTARINDVRIYYELQGAGPPLVVIPGLGADVTVFKDFIAVLAGEANVLAFDPRGAGRSDSPDVAYTTETMADDAAGVMDAAAMPSAHVLGVSMGGRIALELALRQPSRVRSLTLISTSARTPMTMGKTWRQYALDGVLGLPVVRSIAPRREDPHLRQREASRGYDRTDRLKEIRVPTLILHGRKDRVVPFRLARRMAAGIEGSRMLTYDGGHLFFFGDDEPEVLDAIRAFVHPA